MLRLAPSGVLAGLSRLLSRGGNDAGGTEIINLGAPSAPSSAARLQDVAGTVPGPFTEYYVGPTWTGAKYQTIQSAVDQAVADGHSGPADGQNVAFFLYPALYTENIVIPATLPRWHLVGEGGVRGSEINGTFTVDLPQTGACFSARSVRFLGAVQMNQPGPATGASVAGNLYFCTFASTFTASLPNVFLEAWSCTFRNAVTWLLRSHRMSGCYFSHASAGVTIEVAPTGGNSIQGCYSFMGTWTFRGRAVGLTDCLFYYYGELAVIDECTAFSEYSGNTFSRNAGPAGPVVRKTGTSSLTDGGNTFVDGATYPYFEIAGGSRPNRGVNDDQLRDVISVSAAAGVTSITPAQLANLDLLILITTGGGSVALPPIDEVPLGARVTVKMRTGAGVSVEGTGINFIDGAASISITPDNGSLTFQSDGVSNWDIVGSYLVP